MLSARHPAAAVAAVFALAFLVAAAVKRQPPDFSVLQPIAVVRDGSRRALWTIRLAAAAHQIAIDAAPGIAPPAGQAYQLWLAGEHGAQSLGLLPGSGRKVIAEIPAVAARLAGRGELIVSLEKARGSDLRQPQGPTVYRADFVGGG